MPEPTATLLSRSLAQQQQFNLAALAAIEARAPDIHQLERLSRALRARGWRSEPLVETHPYGSASACSLVLLLSCSEPELCDVIEFLAADGIAVTRRVNGDMGCSREYRLRLDRFSVRMNAYVHSPAREAA